MGLRPATPSSTPFLALPHTGTSRNTKQTGAAGAIPSHRSQAIPMRLRGDGCQTESPPQPEEPPSRVPKAENWGSTGKEIGIQC